MKLYTRDFAIKIIILFFALTSGYYNLFDFNTDKVNTYSQEKTIIKNKELASVQDNLVDLSIVKQEEEKKDEEAVYEEVVAEQQSYSAPEASYSQSISISGALYQPLIKDYSGSNFYLDHDINGNYSENGVPYVDFRTNFFTRKTIIYAHSSVYGNGPFQALQNYHNNKGYYDGHRYINISYNGINYTYEIFSVYVMTADNDYSDSLEYFLRMDYSDEEWNNTINQYKNNSEYDTGVSVSGSDKILILQTCSMDPNYYGRYYRYNLLVMGKLVY